MATLQFLEQASLVADEFERMYEHLFGDFDDGLLFYYFGFIDQVSHVMWHAMDEGHPAYDEARDRPPKEAPLGVRDLPPGADSYTATDVIRDLLPDGSSTVC